MHMPESMSEMSEKQSLLSSLVSVCTALIMQVYHVFCGRIFTEIHRNTFDYDRMKGLFEGLFIQSAIKLSTGLVNV